MKWSEFLQGVAVSARVREPSSWAGGAVIVQGLGVVFPQYAAVFMALSAILGTVAVKMPEAGKTGGAGDPAGGGDRA